MDRTPVVSSNLVSIGYSSEESILQVEFRNGSIYDYYGIRQEDWEGLSAASSKGQYLDQYIKKGGYSYRRVQ